MNPQIKFKQNGNKYRTKTRTGEDKRPVWNQIISFTQTESEPRIRLRMNDDNHEEDEEIGLTTVPLSDVKHRYDEEIKLPLERDGVKCGQLLVFIIAPEAAPEEKEDQTDDSGKQSKSEQEEEAQGLNPNAPDFQGQQPGVVFMDDPRFTSLMQMQQMQMQQHMMLMQMMQQQQMSMNMLMNQQMQQREDDDFDQREYKRKMRRKKERKKEKKKKKQINMRMRKTIEFGSDPQWFNNSRQLKFSCDAIKGGFKKIKFTYQCRTMPAEQACWIRICVDMADPNAYQNSKSNTWDFDPITKKIYKLNKRLKDYLWNEWKCVETEGTAQWTSGKIVINMKKDDDWKDFAKDEDEEYCIRIVINARKCEEVQFKDCKLLVQGGEFAEDSEDSEDDESDE